MFSAFARPAPRPSLASCRRRCGISGVGEHDTALDYFRQAFARYSEAGDTYYMAIILSHMGDSESAVGRERDALAAWRRSLDLLERAGHPDAEKVRAKLHRPS